MIVESLHIKGLKAHRDLKVDLSGATMIKGRNGAGKSTILEAVSFLFGGGIMGESVDGRNMIALVNGSEGVSVEAVVKHCNQKARLRRWRTPTASGLSRSKTSVEMIEGCDDAAFHRALSGDLYGVSHVHEWLHLKWSKLRALIVDLGVDGIEDEIPDQIKEMLNGDYTMNGIKGLEMSISEEVKNLKRDLKTLEQSASQMLDHLEPASAEELEMLYKRKRELELKMSDLDAERNEASSSAQSARRAIAEAESNPILSGEVSMQDARLICSYDDYIKPLEERVAQLSVDRTEAKYSAAGANDKLRDMYEQIDRFTAASGDQQCPCCMQQIDADFAKAKAAELELEAVNLRENSEFLSAVAEGLDDEVKAAEMNLADSRQRHYELLPALGKAEAYQSLDDVRQALDVATAALAGIEEKTAGISGLISENYSEIARVESILNQQKLVRSATAQIDDVKSKITDGKTLLLSIESLLGVIARNGKDRVESKVKSYYGGSELGEPTISMNDGRIGLERDDVFYAGIALSGAEQDLLSTAIDCAIKDLQGIPKVVLMEADSLDQANLSKMTAQLGLMMETGNLDQVVIATWFDMPTPDGWTSVTL